MADESGIQVLHEAGRPATSKSYMWLYRSGTGPPIVLFDYRQTREAKHPEKFLSGFSGYLCTDGYAAYYGLPAVINVSCFAHGRRGFYDAFMALPKKARNKESASFKGLQFVTWCSMWSGRCAAWSHRCATTKGLKKRYSATNTIGTQQRCQNCDHRVGGGIAPTVLPHHRTYGSVSGGSSET